MDSINKLINIFRDFPAVGPRTAARFVYYLLKLPKQNIDELVMSIQELQNKIKLCGFCFSPFEPSLNQTLCPICKNSARNKKLLCVVEKENDLLSIEKTKKYNGIYFILGGTSRLRLEELKKRVTENNFGEIIIALNPTPEGRTTSALVESEIKELAKSPACAGGTPLKITHLAQGIPVGGELEYADEETLESALEGRK